MSLMISLGIAVSHLKIIPEIYKGTFFISLGLSLLASSVFYIIEGVQFVIQIHKALPKNKEV
jgi:Na+-transporting NADH:ubiquinone oxidoreductase subunit NqrD